MYTLLLNTLHVCYLSHNGLSFVVRGERYEYQRLLLEGTVDGKRGQGRPRKIAISGGPWSRKSLMDMEPVID